LPRPIGVIQNTGFFTDILQRFGVNRPQAPFLLDGDVVPVVLIDSAISFVAAPSPPYGVTDIFTAGVVVAPAAGTILADTGPLPVGAYTIQVFISAGEGNRWLFQWRNVANAADLWTQNLRNAPAADPRLIEFSTRLNIENANERFRVLNDLVGTAAVEYQATILAKI